MYAGSEEALVTAKPTVTFFHVRVPWNELPNHQRHPPQELIKFTFNPCPPFQGLLFADQPPNPRDSSR